MSDTGKTKRKPKDGESGADAPATKPKAADAPSELPVETWFRRKGVSKPIQAALMRHTRWGAGRAVNEKTFDAALSALLKKPVGGAKT